MIFLSAAISVLCLAFISAKGVLAQSTTDSRVTDFKSDGFYLPPFTPERRAELHSFHIANTDFSLQKKSPSISSKQCLQVLELAKNIGPDDILKPNIIAWGDPIPDSLHGRCSSDFQLDTDYFPSLEGWKTLDDAFGMRSSFLEAYDLSAFLGDGFYGIFSQGGRPICNKNPERHVCTDMLGYEGRIKIANIDNCEIAVNGAMLYSMLRVVVRQQGKKVDQYQYGGFYAFVNLNGAIYALVFRTDYLPDDLCRNVSISPSCSASRSRTDFFIHGFYKDSFGGVQTNFCSFKPNLKD